MCCLFYVFLKNEKCGFNFYILWYIVYRFVKCKCNVLCIFLCFNIINLFLDVGIIIYIRLVVLVWGKFIRVIK